MPRHIAIIMDGNGRWAKQRGLTRSMGHRQGVKTVEKITKYCKSIGLKHLTLYAFSTENWSRPKQEVDSIMDLLREYLNQCDKHPDENVRTRFLGERSQLPADLVQKMDALELRTNSQTEMNLNIAINYGGRDEIIHATRRLARLCADGKMSPDAIDEKLFGDYLYTEQQPDPDMIIRPSGEMRLSNFLLWQSAYAEFFPMNDVLWPDFTPAHLDKAIEQFLTRDRRYGGVR